ncbi:hypothetical protein BJX68DRAFT_266923 [Aspergillus pseudodeflectus]|uniref:C-type lectin domain-containing protein n=1 Tax=Aspergillus pseudodeflectus TaxID=176178 RepID=A0ABR4KBE2_9EURO
MSGQRTSSWEDSLRYIYCGSAGTAAPVPTDVTPGMDENCRRYYLVKRVQLVGIIETYPGYRTTTTPGTPISTTAQRWNDQTGAALDWNSLPDATTITSWTSISTPANAPLANGTKQDCVEYKDNDNGNVPCDWLCQLEI